MAAPDLDVTTLLAQARRWIDEDPDLHTRMELSELITTAATPSSLDHAAAVADLADRFSGSLEFGTAGLRGALGAGPRRMNRTVVIRAAAGLVAYLRQQGASRGASVVIGYDARRQSDVFARDTAEVVTGAGLTALLLPRPLPTPVLAFAIRELGCVAGVMVTASHNPPQDNGYKVYLGDGSQIVSPVDSDIASCIAEIGPPAAVPRGRPYVVLSEEVVDTYLDTVAALVEDGPRDLRVIYTPLHGVGAGCVSAVLETAGFAQPHVVPEQEHPDPEFPTVSFPNPEEPGAMDLALDLATEDGADLVVANDPDADRCAVAVPGPGGWRMLTGDEVGALLGRHVLERAESVGRDPVGTFAASIVSSSLLGRIAAEAGRPYVETLTGFKWIGRVPGLAFGYEEALGYCVDPDHVRDKDGISALLLVCELAARLKAEGRTLLDALDDLARTYGVHLTRQISVRVADLSDISTMMDALRAQPPRTLGGQVVDQVDDLSLGSARLPPTDGLRYTLAGGGRLIVRPSGTEPKLKCYLEVVVPFSDPLVGTASRAEQELADTRRLAAERLTSLADDVEALLR
jgi:phosphomannomutase